VNHSPCALACDNSLSLQGRISGTPNAGPMTRNASREREGTGTECSTERTPATRTKREAVALLSDPGAAAMSRPCGRKPYGRAVTLRRWVAPAKGA
jgi:hypothetical protein